MLKREDSVVLTVSLYRSTVCYYLSMIRKIRIENFRSIADSGDVYLPKFGAIIGKNASGKSNFLSAIAFLKELVTGVDIGTAINGITPMTSEFFYVTGSPNRPAASTLISTFKFTIETDSGRHFEFTYQVGLNSTKQPPFFINSETLIEIVNGSEKSIYTREGENVFGEGTSSPTKILLNRLALASHPDESSQQVANAIRSYTIINEQPKLRGDAILVSENRIDTNTVEGLAVSLQKKDRELFNAAMACIKKIIPLFEGAQIQAIESSTASDSVDINSEEKKNPKLFFVLWSYKGFVPHSSASLSNGDRRTIFLMLSLFNSRSKSFFIAEEIENGMHYQRLAKIVDQLRTYGNVKEIQVLFTTHSNEILAALMLDEVLYCRKEPEKGSLLTAIKETAQYEIIKEELRGGSTAADVVNSGMFE